MSFWMILNLLFWPILPSKADPIIELAQNFTQNLYIYDLGIIYAILGKVWTIKVVSKFLFPYPKCHFGAISDMSTYSVGYMALWATVQKGGLEAHGYHR